MEFFTVQSEQKGNNSGSTLLGTSTEIMPPIVGRDTQLKKRPLRISSQ